MDNQLVLAGSTALKCEKQRILYQSIRIDYARCVSRLRFCTIRPKRREAGLREQVGLRQRGLRVPSPAQAIFLNYAGVSAERRPEEARRMHAYLPDTVSDSHSCDQLSATPAAFDARCPGKLRP
ncbi:hypothetical protein SRHO_G00138760 [Serrasalmus rhombeus]